LKYESIYTHTQPVYQAQGAILLAPTAEDVDLLHGYLILLLICLLPF